MRRPISSLCVALGFITVGCGGSESRTLLGAAGGSSSSAGASSGGARTGGAPACSPGNERCDCYGNGTCNQGLECRSNLCVAAGAGGSTSVGGGASGGAPSGGQTASGGTENGGTAAGTGGDSGPGGGNATGGVVGNGGTSTGAGGAATGGVSPSAGTTSTGGVPSIGGTRATGGSAGGGGSNTGGIAAATGGVSSAGQASTGGDSSLCGNGIVDPGESCDPLPKNNDLGDGCTPDCKAEPSCPAAGGPCTSRCGDGLVMGSEACDDGNTNGGDGCAADCTVEPDYTCTQPPLGDTMVVPMVVRDFNAGGDFEKGSTFATGLNYANQGLLQGTLDNNGLKPVLAFTSGTYNGKTGTASGIASIGSFAQWYDDTATGPNLYHGTLATSLKLFLNSDGTVYVNRYGTNGDGANSAQFVRTSTPGSNFCGYVGQEDHDAQGNPIPCTYCPLDSDPSTPQCDSPYPTYCQTNPSYIQCAVTGTNYSGIYLLSANDGNPLFFPADGIAKPWSPDTTGQIPGNYDPSWPLDPVTGRTHNFSFTTEVRFWFVYDASKSYKLTFQGDDDFWVFVNKRLAVDMGGIHTPVNAVLTIDTTGTTSAAVSPTNVTPATAITSRPDLGLQNGNVYEVAIFQAERQTKASSYMISLAGFNTAPSFCTK